MSILIEDLGLSYPTENSKRRYRYGLFSCSCGSVFKARMDSKVKSCGCLYKTKQGLTQHRLYKTWEGMIQRCTNFKNPSYKHYGAIGIKVHPDWFDIRNFIDDMYPTFQEGLTLDRRDNNQGYSIENCRWADRATQNSNTRVLRATNTSGYRGVSWSKKSKKWLVQIQVKGERTTLGYYTDKIQASEAYDSFILENKLEHTVNKEK